MSKRRKRLERIRQNPTNVSFDDLQLVLRAYGFRYRQASGSHYTFSYVLDGRTRVFVVPFRRPLKSIYVKQAIKLIDQIVQEQGEDEPDED